MRLKIQKMGSGGKDLMVDSFLVCPLDRDEANNLSAQLSEHFPDDKDRRIADLVANVEALKKAHDGERRLSAYRHQECEREYNRRRVAESELAALKAQPSAEPLLWSWLNEDGVEWHTPSEHVAQMQWKAGFVVYGPESPHFFASRPKLSEELIPYIPSESAKQPPASIQKRKPFTGGVVMGPAQPGDELKGGVFSKDANGEWNEQTEPPASILKDDPAHWSDCAVYNAPALPVGPCDCGGLKSANKLPEHSAFGYENKSANKSAESQANALRGNLENDAISERDAALSRGLQRMNGY